MLAVPALPVAPLGLELSAAFDELPELEVEPGLIEAPAALELLLLGEEAYVTELPYDLESPGPLELTILVELAAPPLAEGLGDIVVRVTLPAVGFSGVGSEDIFIH